eukprot:gene5246-6070_t
MDKNDNVIITGGQGFIGSWVAKMLVKEKHYNVVIVDVKPDDHILQQVLTSDEMKKVSLIYIDISDTSAVLELVKHQQPAFIIHLAGLQIPTCRSLPVLGAQVNVIGTINVLEAVKQLKDQTGRVCPVIYASSAAVSGPSEDYDGPVQDNAHHVPLTHYGVFKQANEGSARVYWMDHKIPSVALRPFTVYGVGREVGVTSAPTKVIKSLVFGQDYTIPFSGQICVNYVEDIAKLFIDLGRSKFEGAHVEGGKLPFPTEFTEETLVALLGSVKTTTPKEGIEKTYALMQSLHEIGVLDKRDL